MGKKQNTEKVEQTSLKKRDTELNEKVEQTASQMMKSGKPGMLKATQFQKTNFQRRHQKQIQWVIQNLPRCSAAISAVVTKCLIRYDKALVAKFCKALKMAFFEGPDDPAMLLWKFMQRHRGKDTTVVYGHAVCAAKAYMEGRKIKNLQVVKRDIFDWDEGWTVPDDLIANWNPDFVPNLEILEANT